MKNIIIAGDSFCAGEGWPEELAQHLNLKLYKHGFGAASWWITRLSLRQLPKEVIDNTEIVVLCHTSENRIPVADEKILKIDYKNMDNNNPTHQAIKYFWTELFTPEFHQFYHWARYQWLKEVTNKFKHCKIIHLHCFFESENLTKDLQGLTVTPNLLSISLNEIDAKSEFIRDCGRQNHFNGYNNSVLANELFRLITDYHQGTMSLDLTKFELKTNRWFYYWRRDENIDNGITW